MEKMYSDNSVDNVINYLSGKSYNEQTILEDIKYVDFLNNIDYYGKDVLMSLFEQMVDQRVLEINYVDYYMFSDFPLDENFTQINTYYNFPFRFSRDAVVDANMIRLFLHLDVPEITRNDDKLYDFENMNSYVNFIKKIIEKKQLNVNPDFIKEFKKKCMNLSPNPRRIYFQNMKTAVFVGKNKPRLVPLDEDKVKRNFVHNQTDTNAVGDLGELHSYLYLKDHLPEYSDICWVSNYVGDGFGYDIYAIDYLTGKGTTYEVKAHTNIDEFEKNTLTKNEERIELYSHLDITNYDYKLVKVLLCPVDGSIQRMEIRHKEGDEWVSEVIYEMPKVELPPAHIQ